MWKIKSIAKQPLMVAVLLLVGWCCWCSITLTIDIDVIIIVVVATVVTTTNTAISAILTFQSFLSSSS